MGGQGLCGAETHGRLRGGVILGALLREGGQRAQASIGGVENDIRRGIIDPFDANREVIGEVICNESLNVIRGEVVDASDVDFLGL